MSKNNLDLGRSDMSFLSSTSAFSETHNGVKVLMRLQLNFYVIFKVLKFETLKLKQQEQVTLSFKYLEALFLGKIGHRINKLKSRKILAILILFFYLFRNFWFKKIERHM